MRPRYEYISRLTKQLRTEANLDDSIPVDLSKILNAYCINWELRDLDNNVSGFSTATSEQKLIVVNKANHYNRRRFTVAHELGHLLLHFDNVMNLNTGPIYYRDEKSSSGEYWREIEANYFAGCLLMPSQSIEDLIGQDRNAVSEDKIAEISKKFRVSTQAVCVRLSQMGRLGRTK